MKIFALMFAGLLTAAPALADDKCVLKEVASLPIVRTTPDSLDVMIDIQGRPYEFAVQINGLYSQIESSLVQSLQLNAIALPPGTGLVGSDGMPIQQVTVPDVSLGMTHISSYRMLAVHDYTPPTKAQGTIALDLLSKFDIEINLKGGLLKLFSRDHCPGQGVYWANSMVVLPFQRDFLGGTTFKMQLDGRDVVTDFSTTVAIAHMGMMDANYIFGITPQSPNVTPLPPPDTGKYRAEFKNLSMDGLAIDNLSVILDPQDKDHFCYGPGRPTCSGTAQLELGLAELEKLHVFYSFSEKTLYITPADDHK